MPKIHGADRRAGDKSRRNARDVEDHRARRTATRRRGLIESSASCPAINTAHNGSETLHRFSGGGMGAKLWRDWKLIPGWGRVRSDRTEDDLLAQVYDEAAPGGDPSDDAGAFGPYPHADGGGPRGRDPAVAQPGFRGRGPPLPARVGRPGHARGPHRPRPATGRQPSRSRIAPRVARLGGGIFRDAEPGHHRGPRGAWTGWP